MGSLITISGIDGSGKTTMAKSVANSLCEHGLHCSYSYGRIKPILARPLITAGRLVFLKGEDRQADYAGYSRARQQAMRGHGFLFAVYRSLLLLDYAWQILARVSLPLVFGRVVICDRYIFDTVISDLCLHAGWSRCQIKKLIDRLFQVFPAPSIAFLIDLPEEIAYARKSDTPSLEYLKEQRGLYRDMAEEYGLMVLDGTRSLRSLQQEMVGAIWNVIRS